MNFVNKFLIVHQRAHTKIFVFLSLIAFLTLFLIIIVSVNYSKSLNSFNYFEENDPDIDLTGLSGFSFKAYSTPSEYTPSISNLGTTGNIIFDCFKGECSFQREVTARKKVCSGGSCRYRKVTYNLTYYELAYSCSNECRENGGEKFCYSCPSNAKETKGECSRDTNDYYNFTKSCQADNLIYNWKGLYYDRINNTEYKKYSYLKNAVTLNESCPEGTKMCGILDELGNKLCLPLEEKCPINYIKELNYTPNDNYTYKYTEIGNKKIYYTNEAISTGKIVGGLFADSDLLINYKEGECEILDTGSISEFIYNNSKLYRDVLNYNPYDDNNIDNKGKSYLKWCIPGHGKNRDINTIKKVNLVYIFNTTTNRETIKPIKENIEHAFTFSLIGYIVLLVYFGIFIFMFFSKNGIDPNLCSCVGDGCFCFIFFFLILLLIDSLIFNILASIYSLDNNSYFSKGKDLNLNFIDSLITLNRIYFWGNLFLYILIIAFFVYLYLTPKDDNQIVYNNGNEQSPSNNNSEVPYYDMNQYNSINPGANTNSAYDNRNLNYNTNEGYSSSDYNYGNKMNY